MSEPSGGEKSSVSLLTSGGLEFLAPSEAPKDGSAPRAGSLVRRAIDELPAAQREVLHLRIYDEKTFAQIAAELNIPLGTALARMRAALAKLRKRLSDENP